MKRVSEDVIGRKVECHKKTLTSVASIAPAIGNEVHKVALFDMTVWFTTRVPPA